MRVVTALLAAVLLAAGIGGCGGDGAEPGAPVGATLVLDFIPNAAHSGIYAAQREGFYRDAGLKLTIRQPGESTDAPKLLAAGRTDFAILDIHDLGIARERPGEDGQLSRRSEERAVRVSLRNGPDDEAGDGLGLVQGDGLRRARGRAQVADVVRLRAGR